MARQSKLSDEALRDCLAQGMTQAQIARACHMSEAAISMRVKALETRAALKAPQQVMQAASRVWDVQTACQENYERALSLLDACESAGDKTRVVAEIRKHLQFAMTVIQTLYSAQEVQAFQEEVLRVIEEAEPGLRETIIARLRDRRSIRAAFMPH